MSEKAEPSVGLKKEQRQKLADLLKPFLADEVVLTTKLRNYHWNVEGLYFAQFHELFEKQYEETFEIADEIAEYIRFYGIHSPGSLKEFLELTRLQESSGMEKPIKDMLQDVLNDHETIIRNLRDAARMAGQDLDDPAVEDFLISLVHKHQKMAWMIRASLN